MIREFQTADLDQVMKIWLEQNLLAHSFIDPSFFQKNTDLVRMILPSSEIYVQDICGVKGFIGLTNLYISGLFIDSEYQRQGLGSSLIEKAKQVRSKLFLNVYTENEAAVQFYEKHGFIRLEDRINEETHHPEYLMGCKIDHTVKIGKCAL
ncbi:GNAT family N-acetyltransferase [Commensalibacter communis]|uniref:GNAT family N-acetyltransferase n=1 Tax=Commensalibacter communis TaxID=2972786 RepID=UPI0022FF7A1B|nr:GNAT family N-acetyltransferase [Commensalibacter communis]CAI3934214.1 Ribosomal protein S18 acetylase RimI and related acetyltransferases (RimI) (PDB:1GHE) [Commensalibacter communis]CAI3944021.1 Ribosomal protein S18 acetylase RimI and related acetyltransferases (RimI) (PDB:1GHE) [Commensalibacter communis]